MASRSWRVRLGHEAGRDLASILRWTAGTFGPRQAEAYRDTLIAALTALEAGPTLPGSTARDEIYPGIRTLHVAREGRRGRHAVMNQKTGESTIEVLRILHDSMDLARHLPPEEPTAERGGAEGIG